MRERSGIELTVQVIGDLDQLGPVVEQLAGS
jgi:hypothetical protein